jgi:hypothetical protein
MMGLPRVTLANALVLVLIIALWTAAFRLPSLLWQSIALTLVSWTMLTAAVGIVLCRERSRAFWLGFLCFGASYLLMVFGPWYRTEIGPYLPTTRLFDELYPLIHRPPTGSRLRNIVVWDYEERSYSNVIDRFVWRDNRNHFLAIGHALTALLLALLGSRIALHLHAAGSNSPTVGSRRASPS